MGTRHVDLLVVGSGAAGLVAALTAAASGAKVLVVEKQPVLGGTTALSGGAFWIPDNTLYRAAGGRDSYQEARTYLDGLVGDAVPDARKQAYLHEGPRMVEFLLAQGMALRYARNYPDYYASRAGGKSEGRSIESHVFQGRRLGADLSRLGKRNILPSLAVTSEELAGLANGVRTWSSLRTNLRVVARSLAGMLMRRAPLTMGMALIAQLLHALRRHDVELLTDTPLLRLIVDANGSVTGAVVREAGRDVEIRATQGVVLATGGFARSAGMRRLHQPRLHGDWTHATAGDEGDGIRAGVAVGAATAQMEEAWWMPTSVMADGTRVMAGPERSKPFSIMVDLDGQRFCNECGSYMEVGQKMLQRRAGNTETEPRCWFVFESRYRRHYPFGLWPAGYTPRSAIESGYLIRADSLDALARRCNINAEGLQRTVQRYNAMCASGRDDDFGRGDDPYDRFYGDPRIQPNPTMGPLVKPPFYAIAFHPGDIGTNGGLLTDEHARVLRADGHPIDGLYAAGNCTASVMGHVYPGAGATIGPAMVFGFVAARHATQHHKQQGGSPT